MSMIQRDLGPLLSYQCYATITSSLFIKKMTELVYLAQLWGKPVICDCGYVERVTM